jgi:hypothetical protein
VTAFFQIDFYVEPCTNFNIFCFENAGKNEFWQGGQKICNHLFQDLIFSMCHLHIATWSCFWKCDVHILHVERVVERVVDLNLILIHFYKLEVLYNTCQL